MPRLSPLCAAAAIIAMTIPVAAAQFPDTCRAFATAEVIFVGRVKSAPIMRRISAEPDIEKARLASEAAERDLKAFEALKMPLEIGGGRHIELTIRMVKAREEYNRTRAMYPPPIEISVTPILVEEPLRGVTTAELFMVNRGEPELDPARSYLFFATRRNGPLAPDVITAEGTKDVESAAADLRFLRDAVANDRGAFVRGSLTLWEPVEQRTTMRLGGVVLRVSLGDQLIEITTGADGSFFLSGVPPGIVKIEADLPDHLTMRPEARRVLGGCMEMHMRATFNGRIRGRVLLDSGAPFRGIVDLVPDNPKLQLTTSHAFTNDLGEFSFSALPPGNYRVGINVLRQPSSGAAFRPTYFPGTTDPSQATSVLVGLGTETADVEWLLNARLREGSIDVSFDTHGQPPKDAGVCITMFDDGLRPNGGHGYGTRTDGLLTVPVVEGVRYRLVAWAQLASGSAESEPFDVIGAPGRQALKLQLASVSETASGMRCSSPSSSKPFSPSR